MYKWLKKIIGLTTVFTAMPYFAFAVECKEVRLDEVNSVFDKIPVYNQLDFRGVDANLCYAIVGSQLIDEYRFRNGDALHTLSSPLSLAVGFKESYAEKYKFEIISTENISSSILGGGFIEETILANAHAEICDQNTIENEASLMQADSFAKLNKTSVQQFVENTLLKGNSPKIKSFSKLDFLFAVKNELKRKCQGNAFVLDKIKPESLSQGDYLEDLKNHMNVRNNPSLSEEQKRHLTMEFLKKHDKQKKIEKFHEKINFLLNQRIPVGIGYLMEVLERKSGTTGFDAHASVITGQRWNQKSESCELLVRDSYGSNCKDERGDERYARPCDKGSVWVDSKILLGKTEKITWIP